MNVLYCSEGYTTHDRRFLASLAGSGCSVCFLRLTDRVYDQRPLPDGVKPVSWDYAASAALDRETCDRMAISFRRVWAAEKPDVALAGPIQTGALVAALSGCRPYVAMSWGSDLLVRADESDAMRACTREALAGAAGGLGDCDAVEAAFLRYSTLSRGDLAMFPWGIDLQDFAPKQGTSPLRASLGWLNQVLFVCSRSWEPIHSIDILVEAFAALRNESPEARLVLLGDGGQKGTINQLIADRGLRDWVHAPGRVSNDRIREYFLASDVYVSATLSDGSSISLLEAMACALPVVVANAYGNKEWVVEGENGWLAEPGGVDSLTRALRHALASRPMFPAMGKRNRNVVESRADWNRNYPALIRLLERAAAGGSRE